MIGARVPSGGSVVHAFVWDSGTLTDLGTLGGAESDSAAISARNQIVGVSNTRRGARHPVLWTSGSGLNIGRRASHSRRALARFTSAFKSLSIVAAAAVRAGGAYSLSRFIR